jgi:hypothetical protein
VQHTLTVLGKEIGDDLSINFDQAALPAFIKFTNTVSRLRWTRLSDAPLTVKRYVSTETDVLDLLPSDLCQDALLAAAPPDKLAAGTRSFLKNYTRASEAADEALANLLKMMQSYEIPGEKTLITRIASLVSQVSSLTKSDLLESGSALTTSLETT